MKLLNGLANKADKLGYIAGALAGSPQGLNDIISSIQQMVAGNIHVPDFIHIQTWLQSEYFKNTLYAYLAGMGMDVLDVPLLGKYGKTIQKGALAYGTASLGVTILWAMTHSNIKGVNILNKTGAANAPTIQQAQMMYY